MMRYQNPFLALLVCGMFAQVLLLIRHTRDAGEPFAAAPAVLVGDTLGTLSGQLPDGTSTVVPLTADPGTMTVLYSFHPECKHCDTVAPAWASHFASVDPTVRRIALTAELHEPAVTYAARFGWSVDLLSVSQLGLTDREYSLVSRTPWLFVFDWKGVLRFQDHGSELGRVKQVVAAISSGSKRHGAGGAE